MLQYKKKSVVYTEKKNSVDMNAVKNNLFYENNLFIFFKAYSIHFLNSQMLYA